LPNTEAQPKKHRADLEGPGARSGVVVDELGAHLAGGALQLLAVAAVEDAGGVGERAARLLARGPDAVQRDLGGLVERVADGRLLALVRVDVHLLAADVHRLVQVQLPHVRHARERDAAVVDAADREVLHEAVAWPKGTANIKRNYICHK